MDNIKNNTQADKPQSQQNLPIKEFFIHKKLYLKMKFNQELKGGLLFEQL